MAIPLDLQFKITPQELPLTFGEVQTVTHVETVTENDHDKLGHRDLPDQHPIGAITGLDKELSGITDTMESMGDDMGSVQQDILNVSDQMSKKLDSESAMSNLDIQKILNS